MVLPSCRFQDNSKEVSVLLDVPGLEDTSARALTLIYVAALPDTLKLIVRVGARALADAASEFVLDGLSRSRRI